MILLLIVSMVNAKRQNYHCWTLTQPQSEIITHDKAFFGKRTAFPYVFEQEHYSVETVQEGALQFRKFCV